MVASNARNGDQGSTADLIAAAAVKLAGEKGWRALALGDIAAHAGVTLAELSRCYGTRAEILDGFERMIDARMLAGAAAGDIDDAPRDRLFDVMMERFDALQPYRDGVRRIARELPFDPQSGLVLACALPRSISWMFAGARIAVEGPSMPLRVAALSSVYLAALRCWMNDDSQDMAKTMALLDRQLDRAKRILGGEFGRTRPAEPPAAPQPAPAEVAPEPRLPSESASRAAGTGPQPSTGTATTGGRRAGGGSPRKRGRGAASSSDDPDAGAEPDVS